MISSTTELDSKSKRYFSYLEDYYIPVDSANKRHFAKHRSIYQQKTLKNNKHDFVLENAVPPLPPVPSHSLYDNLTNKALSTKGDWRGLGFRGSLSLRRANIAPVFESVGLRASD